jgi:hypothetical protein
MKRQDRHHGRQNSKAPQNTGGSQAETRASSEGNSERHIYLESIAVLDVVEELKEQHNRERCEDASHQRKQLLWTIIAAGLVFLYTLTAFWQGLSNQKAASAATKAADTARDALHISERAYNVAGKPSFDLDRKFVSIPIQNIGHIPSGDSDVIYHEATFNKDTFAVENQSNAVEFHWKHITFIPIVPATPMGFSVYLPSLDANRLSLGMQSIKIAGTIRYWDGFEDDGQQESMFCVMTLYSITVRQYQWVGCDARVAIPQLQGLDGYPYTPQQPSSPIPGQEP